MRGSDKKFNLSSRVAVLLVLVCIPITIAALLCLEIIREKSHSYVLVNFAGSERMRIERHANYINRTLTSILLEDWEGAIENKQLAQDVADKFDQSLELLRNGGPVQLQQMDRPLMISGVTDAAALKDLDRVEAEWTETKQAALQALRADSGSLRTDEGYLRFQNQTHRAFEAMDDAVYSLQSVGERQLAALVTIIGAAVAMTLLCLIGAIVFLRLKIVRPFETATAAVHESEQRLHRSTDATQDGLWDWDLKTNEVWFSPRFWELLGFPEEGPFPPGEFESFRVRLHPDDEPMVHATISRHLEEQTPIDIRYRLRLESGGFRWFRARGASERDECGVAFRMSGSIQDITPQVDAENNLRNSESFLRSVLDGQTAHIAILNTDGTIRTANKAWRQFWSDNNGVENSSLAMNYLAVCESATGDCSIDAIIVAEGIRKVLKGESVYESHTYACHSPTKQRWYMVAITPIQGEESGVVVAHYNVTEQIQAQQAAQAANVAKSAFLANMSHEIRTPLTAILGFVETLADNTDKPEDRDAIQTIQRNGDHLLCVINDILDLSKVEAGKMTMESLRANLIELVTEVATLVRIKADGAGITFDVEYLSPIPETITTDPTRLRQILINLLGNAIKFTEVGSVRLRICFVENAPAPHIQFDIIDTGIGMTDAQIAVLFQPFTQADVSMTREFGGTGLGLTISKRYAEILGGDIQVADSRPGVGTTFRLTVGAGQLDNVRRISDPARVVAELGRRTAPRDAANQSIRGVRILLAEDGPDNQRLISHMLIKAGAIVEMTENGLLAVNAAQAARENGDPFDVILMDMQMPVLDGYQATSRLRRLGYTGPIIALTAHAMDGDRDTCIKAGCDDYATKPIDRKLLIAAIARHAGRNPSPAC